MDVLSYFGVQESLALVEEAPPKTRRASEAKDGVRLDTARGHGMTVEVVLFGPFLFLAQL